MLLESESLSSDPSSDESSDEFDDELSEEVFGAFFDSAVISPGNMKIKGNEIENIKSH